MPHITDTDYLRLVANSDSDPLQVSIPADSTSVSITYSSDPPDAPLWMQVGGNTIRYHGSTTPGSRTITIGLAGTNPQLTILPPREGALFYLEQVVTHRARVTVPLTRWERITRWARTHLTRWRP